MNYDLAKQLKDAGFLQPEDRVCANGIFINCGSAADEAYAPTLSELIEACGEEEFRLVGYYIENDFQWQADRNPFDFDQKGMVWAMGKTPEEAVANLWLALNKK